MIWLISCINFTGSSGWFPDIWLKLPSRFVWTGFQDGPGIRIDGVADSPVLGAFRAHYGPGRTKRVGMKDVLLWTGLLDWATGLLLHWDQTDTIIFWAAEAFTLKPALQGVPLQNADGGTFQPPELSAPVPLNGDVGRYQSYWSVPPGTPDKTDFRPETRILP